ncbi:STAS domain-containing protein [Jatrophihabitans endophyticus]|uniref:STAS domain-containing protein n=1 Tax=Jatrophihabitans endophyticus TaxID=1206085 RepID=UPI0019EF48E1|nr:STAS domain-containing protein [Jatrophihabitans endophyticus]MBE7188744.1 STAS domain-containing protein [Jatrophihabitans endophyticus]
MRTTVTWSGDIDLSTVWAAQSELMAVIEAAGADEVVVDLGAVTFLDSMGISALLSARGAAETAGVRLMLSGLSDSIEKLFAVAGLTGLFDIV